MRLLFRGALCCLIALTAQLLSDRAAADTIVLKAHETGTFRTRVLINNLPAEGLIDTGATWAHICPDLARSAGLQLGEEVALETANGRVTGRRVLIASMRVATITLHQVPGVVQPGLKCGEVLVGMAVLRRFCMVVSGDRLILMLPSKLGRRRCAPRFSTATVCSSGAATSRRTRMKNRRRFPCCSRHATDVRQKTKSRPLSVVSAMPVSYTLGDGRRCCALLPIHSHNPFQGR